MARGQWSLFRHNLQTCHSTCPMRHQFPVMKQKSPANCCAGLLSHQVPALPLSHGLFVFRYGSERSLKLEKSESSGPVISKPERKRNTPQHGSTTLLIGLSVIADQQLSGKTGHIFKLPFPFLLVLSCLWSVHQSIQTQDVSASDSPRDKCQCALPEISGCGISCDIEDTEIL